MAIRGQKEAICLLLDCGKSMSQLYDNSDDTLLSLSKTCITNIIRQKIFAESNDELVFMHFPANTGSRSNIGYCNSKFIVMNTISLKNPMLNLLRYVSQLDCAHIVTNVVDALTEAFNVLLNLIEGHKYSVVKLVLFTDFGNISSYDKLTQSLQCLINDKFMKHNVQLILVCDQTSRANIVERVEALRIIDENAISVCYDIKPAIKLFEKFECKSVSSIPWYTYLEIGRGDDSLRLPIAGYVKVTEYQPKSGIKTLSLANNDNNDDYDNNETISGDTINESSNKTNKMIETNIEKTVTYRRKNGKSKCKEEDIVQANGSRSKLFRNLDKFKRISEYKSSEKELKVIGFTSIDNISPSHRIGDKTMIIISDPRYKDKNIKYAFQAMIRALCDTRDVAIVRYVYRNESSPQIGYLFPYTEHNNLMLVYIQLPFSEDVRQYRFPLLSAKREFCPSNEQLNAIDDLIDSMDLMSAGIDEECSEALQTEKINNPCLQHWYHCMYNCYLNVDKPMPSKQLKDTIDVPNKIRQNAKRSLRKVRQLFTLEVLKKIKH